MEKNYEIVLEFVKDISSETKNAETFIYVKAVSYTHLRAHET